MPESDAAPGRGCLAAFDWDGVLADSLAAFRPAFLEACRHFGFHGLEAPGRLMALFDDNMYAAMAALGLQPGQLDGILERFRRNTLERLDAIRLFDGIPAALAAIARNNVVVIVTSNLEDLVARVLARDGVACVSEILGVEAGLDKVGKIRQALSNHPTLPVYYAGDTRGDILEGRRAGATTVAVTWGWHGERRLRQAGPDFWVRSPAELAALFASRCAAAPASGCRPAS